MAQGQLSNSILDNLAVGDVVELDPRVTGSDWVTGLLFTVTRANSWEVMCEHHSDQGIAQMRAAWPAIRRVWKEQKE